MKGMNEIPLEDKKYCERGGTSQIISNGLKVCQITTKEVFKQISHVMEFNFTPSIVSCDKKI